MDGLRKDLLSDACGDSAILGCVAPRRGYCLSSSSRARARDRDRSRRPARPGRAVATVLVAGLLLLGAAAAEAQTAPTVTGVALTSDPNDDDRTGDDATYAYYGSNVVQPDVVEVTVTFSVAVDITGAPQLELDFAGTAKAAACEAATSTTTMVCSYTVVENDSAPNGIAIEADKLTLDDGTIKEAGSTTVNAVLTHSAVAIDSGHKVDGSRPTLVTTGTDAPQTSTDGTQVILTFSEDIGYVDINGVTLKETTGNLTISQGVTATFSGNTVTLTLIPAFTIQYGQSIEMQVRLTFVHDTAGNRVVEVPAGQAVTNNVPQPPAAIDTVEITSDPGMDKIYAPGDNIAVTATFDRAVAVSGTPRIELHLGGGSRGERWAEYSSGTGTTALVFSYTVEATDESDTDGIEVGEFGTCGGQPGPQRRDHHDGRDRGERVPGLRSVSQRQRAPGQLGAADADGRRDVDGRNKGDPDVQRRSRRRYRPRHLRRHVCLEGQGGRHDRGAERTDVDSLRQPGDADAGHSADLGDAGGDGELRRSHQRGRLRRHRGPGGQRRRLLHRPDGDQSLRPPGGLVGRVDLRPRSRQHLRHRRRGRGDGDLRRGGRHLRLPAAGAGL